MDNSELIGRLVAVFLFACLAFFFLVRGIRAKPRSRRLANLSIFCGLVVFVAPEVMLRLSPTTWPRLFLVLGLARALFGLAGVILAIAALRIRRDGGVGLPRPILGTVFSLLHLLTGGSVLLLSSNLQPSPSWVYQSPDESFRLTLPSHHWKQANRKGEVPVVAFVRPVPRMQAAVLAVRRQQTEAGFGRIAQSVRARIEGHAARRGQLRFRRGTNAAGNPYHYCTIMDSGRDGQALLSAYSVTWLSSKQMVLEVFFEGVYAMSSQMGQTAETDLIEKAAEAICLSVE